MSTGLRLIGFAAILAVVFAAASIAGAELDPGVEDPDRAHEESEKQMRTTTKDHTAADAGSGLPGLAVAAGGLQLVPDHTRFTAGAAELGFRIADRGGQTVRHFEVEHERLMHVIVVRSDFTGFQHLHPRQREDGGWTTTAELEPGTYRMFADFATAERSLTLGADLFVAGQFTPADLPEPSTVADVGDGYEVVLHAEDGGTSFEVRRGGRAVDSVEPYLGADGHLVALREHDQAFLHTHPEDNSGGSGPIRFGVEYPSAGRYRLFLQFKHDGEVRTAAFTQQIGGPTTHTEETDDRH